MLAFTGRGTRVSGRCLTGDVRVRGDFPRENQRARPRSIRSISVVLLLLL